MDMVIQSQHTFEPPRWRQVLILLYVAILFITLGCGSGAKKSPDNSQKSLTKALPSLGYTIQAGAFLKQNNAVRFTEKLQAQGLNAYHFRSQSGLYQVRIGNYRTIDTARRKAENLKTAGIIDEYYIIAPGSYASVAPGSKEKALLRKKIVRTANRFIGVRYRWGGQSSETGFDCSGLTMVVYRLNGLELPRSSRQQWKSGRPVDPGKLSTGDLVFFATNGDGRVSHVGIYIGSDNFLHAPGRGRKIRISSMSNKYYKTRYLGARSYL